jgi:N utilization substance protein B
MSRRKARVLAFQALYCHDASGTPLDELLTFDWEAGKSALGDESVLAFARALTAGTVENLEEVDTHIARHLRNWELSRLKRVDLAVLRTAAYSLLFQKDIPGGVVIEEAVAISREYGADGSFKFINGVLDSILKSKGEDG